MAREAKLLWPGPDPARLRCVDRAAWPGGGGFGRAHSGRVSVGLSDWRRKRAIRAWFVAVTEALSAVCPETGWMGEPR